MSGHSQYQLVNADLKGKSGSMQKRMRGNSIDQNVNWDNLEIEWLRERKLDRKHLRNHIRIGDRAFPGTICIMVHIFTI